MNIATSDRLVARIPAVVKIYYIYFEACLAVFAQDFPLYFPSAFLRQVLVMPRVVEVRLMMSVGNIVCFARAYVKSRLTCERIFLYFSVEHLLYFRYTLSTCICV